jgi:hypothetical protein
VDLTSRMLGRVGLSWQIVFNFHLPFNTLHRNHLF